MAVKFLEDLNVDGNLGVGVTTPSEKLEVSGVIKFSGGYVLDSSHSLRIDSASSQPILFSHADSEVMRISSGDVGIGTTSPNAKLSVKSDATNNWVFRATSSDGGDLGGIYEDGGTNAELYIKDSTGASSVVINSSGNSYLNGGNVGIGTSSPSEKLHIVGDLKVQTNVDAGVIHFGDTSDQTKIVGYDSSDSNTRFDFFTSGSKKLTILDSGNVGIGTDSPDHLLQVESSGNAEIQAQRVAGAGVLIQSQSAVGVVGTNTNHRLDLKTNNSTRATISTSGNFGIGTSAPAKKLDVNGDTNITGYLDLKTSSPTGSPLLRFYQSTTRRGFIQMADTNDNLRVASEYGSVSLEAAATSGVDSDTSYIRIKPGGTVEIGAVDGDATISTDGSMTFKIDADNDETSQKFSFVNNAGTEVASIDESGNLTLNGGINLSLPTSPGTTGTLWNDRGTVRVS